MFISVYVCLFMSALYKGLAWFNRVTVSSLLHKYPCVLSLYTCHKKIHRGCICEVYLPEPSSVAVVDLAWPVLTMVIH